MRTFNHIIAILTAIPILNLFALSVNADARTVNRIALGLKRNIFLESDMVLYLQVKSCVEENGRMQSLGDLLSAKAFENYRREMIIHEESTRLGSFEASPEQMASAKLKLQGCRSGLEPLLQKYLLSAASLEPILSQVLRSSAFRFSKLKQSEVLSTKERRGALFSNHYEKWFLDLERKHVTESYGSLDVYK